MSVIATHSENLDALHSFAATAEEKLSAAENASLEILKDDVKDLAQSPDIKILLHRILKEIHQNICYSPTEFRGHELVLIDSEKISLSLSLLTPQNAAGGKMADFPMDALLYLLGPDSLKVNLYQVPSNRQSEVFDPSQSLTLTEQFMLAPGESVFIRSGVQVCDFEIPADVVILKMLSRKINPLIWTYDKISLAPLYSSSSNLQASRIKTSVQLLSQLSMRLGVDADTLQNTIQLTTHPLHFIRWSAIQTLFSLDREQGTKALIIALDDSHPHIRNAARRSYAKLTALNS